MGLRQIRQLAACSRRKREFDASTVPAVGLPLDKTGASQAVGQAHRAVRLDRQPYGELTHRQPAAESFYGEKRLVLLRRQAGCACGLLAESQELPQQLTEFRQVAIVGFGQWLTQLSQVVSFRDAALQYIAARYMSPARRSAYV